MDAKGGGGKHLAKSGKNRYRFQSFTEQIKKLQIDVHRDVAGPQTDALEEEAGCYFNQELQRLREVGYMLPERCCVRHTFPSGPLAATHASTHLSIHVPTHKSIARATSASSPPLLEPSSLLTVIFTYTVMQRPHGHTCQ